MTTTLGPQVETKVFEAFKEDAMMPDPDLGTRACDSCAKCGGSRHMHYGRDHEFVETQPSRQDDGRPFVQPLVTELHRQSASMFFCWPTNAIDLCKEDKDLPAAIDKLAAFIAVWEAKGADTLTRPTRDAAEGAEKEAVARENHWRKLEGRIPAAPPKPTPDATLNKLRSRLENANFRYSGGTTTVDISLEDRLALIALIRTVNTEAVLSAPVPPADGTSAQQLRTLLKFVKSQREQFVNPEVCDQICEMIAGAVQSPAVAAENSTPAAVRSQDTPHRHHPLLLETVNDGALSCDIVVCPEIG